MVSDPLPRVEELCTKYLDLGTRKQKPHSVQSHSIDSLHVCHENTSKELMLWARRKKK
jgi:hypothetical protein